MLVFKHKVHYLHMPYRTSFKNRTRKISYQCGSHGKLRLHNGLPIFAAPLILKDLICRLRTRVNCNMLGRGKRMYNKGFLMLLYADVLLFV